jgi:hypothetical protein
LVFDYEEERQINARIAVTDIDPVQATSSVARQDGGCKRAKYQPLRDYLTAHQDQERLRMIFAEVATILGEPLPESAFKYREWWANQTDTTNRPQVAAWLDAGFAVEVVHQDDRDGWVEFARQ